jgi:outer membrane protein assembly factor BamB
VFFPGGDGWLYAFHARTGKLIWKCDLNPKNYKWELVGTGKRNSVLARPVVYNNSVIIAGGQDPEHGEGVGNLWRIDATKTGDVSWELGEKGKRGRPNPNSGIIWRFGGMDNEDEVVFRRTLSSPAITSDGLLFITDLSGFFYCLDVETGKQHWIHDFLSGVWASPRLYRDHVLIGNEDGELCVFKATKKENKPYQFSTVNYSSIYATLHIDGDNIYVTDRVRLTKFDFTAD